MNEKTVTLEQIIAWNPCAYYTRSRLIELLDGRKRISAAEIAILPILPQDRRWALLHPEFLTDVQMHELACRFATVLLEAERAAGREPDPRSWAAIQAKRDWLAGRITDAQLALAAGAIEKQIKKILEIIKEDWKPRTRKR